MKTTIDVPDPLYKRLKVHAAESGVTVRHLVLQGIRRELEGFLESSASSVDIQLGPDGHSAIDEDGWPVLKRDPNDHVVVTNDLVNKLREEEGV
ncbi:MAG: hypothetical protein ACLFP4_15265 [Spirochaetales bacterium]